MNEMITVAAALLLLAVVYVMYDRIVPWLMSRSPELPDTKMEPQNSDTDEADNLRVNSNISSFGFWAKRTTVQRSAPPIEFVPPVLRVPETKWDEMCRLYDEK